MSPKVILTLLIHPIISLPRSTSNFSFNSSCSFFKLLFYSLPHHSKTLSIELLSLFQFQSQIVLFPTLSLFSPPALIDSPFSFPQCFKARTLSLTFSSLSLVFSYRSLYIHLLYKNSPHILLHLSLSFVDFSFSFCFLVSRSYFIFHIIFFSPT